MSGNSTWIFCPSQTFLQGILSWRNRHHGHAQAKTVWFYSTNKTWISHCSLRLAEGCVAPLCIHSLYKERCVKRKILIYNTHIVWFALQWKSVQGSASRGGGGWGGWGGGVLCADKTRFLSLYPVYRIMHSIPGSIAARLSNLMSSCSKWNVAGCCQDESFLPVSCEVWWNGGENTRYVRWCFGPTTDCVNDAVETGATSGNQRAI